VAPQTDVAGKETEHRSRERFHCGRESHSKRVGEKEGERFENPKADLGGRFTGVGPRTGDGTPRDHSKYRMLVRVGDSSSHDTNWEGRGA